MKEQPNQLDNILRLWFREKRSIEGISPPLSSCLDEELMTCYVEGRLSEAEIEPVESHLAQCLDCCDLVVTLFKLDAEPLKAVPPHLKQWAKDLVSPSIKHEVWEIAVRIARGAFEVLQGTADLVTPLTPQPVPVRGEEAADEHPFVVFSREVAGMTVEVDLEQLANQMCNVKVLAKDQETQNLVPSLRFSLFSKGVEVASLAADRGEVLFEQVKPGVYEIRIYRPPKELLGSIALTLAGVNDE